MRGVPKLKGRDDSANLAEDIQGKFVDTDEAL
jgi:hypothetical protein